MAAGLVSAASSSQVVEQVRTLICLYDIDDLNRRTGDHSGGYIAPEEAANVMARLAAAVEERAPQWGCALAREAARA